jgi:hypothetical protein
MKFLFVFGSGAIAVTQKNPLRMSLARLGIDCDYINSEKHSAGKLPNEDDYDGMITIGMVTGYSSAADKAVLEAVHPWPILCTNARTIVDNTTAPYVFTSGVTSTNTTGLADSEVNLLNATTGAVEGYTHINARYKVVKSAKYNAEAGVVYTDLMRIGADDVVMFRRTVAGGADNIYSFATTNTTGGYSHIDFLTIGYYLKALGLRAPNRFALQIDMDDIQSLGRAAASPGHCLTEYAAALRSRGAVCVCGISDPTTGGGADKDDYARFLADTNGNGALAAIKANLDVYKIVLHPHDTAPGYNDRDFATVAAKTAEYLRLQAGKTTALGTPVAMHYNGYTYNPVNCVNAYGARALADLGVRYMRSHWKAILPADIASSGDLGYTIAKSAGGGRMIWEWEDKLQLRQVSQSAIGNGAYAAYTRDVFLAGQTDEPLGMMLMWQALMGDWRIYGSNAMMAHAGNWTIDATDAPEGIMLRFLQRSAFGWMDWTDESYMTMREADVWAAFQSRNYV